MATLTPIDKERMNPREANILEEARLRKIAIQNMQRDSLEAQSIWRDKQVKSYGNLIPVTEETPLSKIITDEQQAQSQDEFLQRQHAMANLATIADQPNVEYIVDRLNFEQLRWLNDNWFGFIRNIKKRNSRMDKNVFVNEIISGQANGTSYEDTFAQDPTQAMNVRGALQQANANAVAERLAGQRQVEEDRRGEEEEQGLNLNATRDRNRVTQEAIEQNRVNYRKVRGGIQRTAPIAVTRFLGSHPIPAITTSQQAGIDASVLNAQLQAIRDASLARTAGGSQNVVGPLTQVGPTVGNQINILGGGGSASPPLTTPEMSNVTSVITIPPAPMLTRTRSISSSINDTDIEKSLKIAPLSTENLERYSRQISDITEALSHQSTAEVKTKLRKLLGKISYQESIAQLKQLTNTKNLNETVYKRMYLLYELNHQIGGTGIRHPKRVIRGRGYSKHEHPTKKPRRHYIGESFYVDLNKLDENILCVKYASNDSNFSRLKVQQITQKTREIIQDIFSNKYDDKIFRILSSDEKRVVHRFIKAVKLDININDDEEKEFQRQFEICRGEYLSGNNSPQIKATLKRYVLEALQENKIARNDAYNLLYSLSL